MKIALSGHEEEGSTKNNLSRASTGHKILGLRVQRENHLTLTWVNSPTASSVEHQLPD